MCPFCGGPSPGVCSRCAYDGASRYAGERKRKAESSGELYIHSMYDTLHNRSFAEGYFGTKNLSYEAGGFRPLYEEFQKYFKR